MAAREPRGSRRRPDAPPPKVERIRPRSGLSRAEVIANQRRRIFDGLAAALAYHGYEDTKVTDIVELAGVSRATFYEHFESKEFCFAAAYEDGVERLAAAVEEAAQGERGEPLRSRRDCAPGSTSSRPIPPLPTCSSSRRLPPRVPPGSSTSARWCALRKPCACRPPTAGRRSVPEETARLLAGGLASHLSGRVLAGEAERLPELHDLLLRYLLAPSLAAIPRCR